MRVHVLFPKLEESQFPDNLAWVLRTVREPGPVTRTPYELPVAICQTTRIKFDSVCLSKSYQVSGVYQVH